LCVRGNKYIFTIIWIPKICLELDTRAVQLQKYACRETLYFVVWQLLLLTRNNNCFSLITSKVFSGSNSKALSIHSPPFNRRWWCRSFALLEYLTESPETNQNKLKT
jgi:hypothetical protein